MQAVDAPATTAHAPSSTSSGDPSPTPSTSKHPFDPAASGPSHPSSFLPNQARHSRRPSRAERYEAIVASAREVLARGTRHSSVEGVGLGLSSSGPTGREGKRRSRLEEVAAESIGRNEWEDAVRSLLRVVDGMTQQLATHDDLAAQLKIAQSNLALAETHSEFLEDTLRRRESVSSSSHAMARHHSGPGAQRRGSADTPEQSSLGGLFGLGLSADGDASGGAKSFFRLPSKRKPTTSNASSASNSLPPPTSRGLRSVASSPLLKDVSPNPASPTDQPRFSSSTFSSIDESSSLSVPFNSGGNSPTFPRELFALQAQVSSLETECTALRSNNASLKRSNETLVAKCAELEKTTEDLMSELENLSVELFSEANTLVADERKLRAKADEEVERLRGDVDALTSQLSSLRVELARRPSFLDVSSPALPALPHSAPTTPAMPMSSDSLQAFPPTADRASSSSRTDTDVDRPISSVSTRRWNPFSRASVPDPATVPPPHSASAPSGTLHAPTMARGDSSGSHVSDASITSFFSSRSHPARSASSAYERSPVLPAAEVQRRVTSPSVKAKDKARELELGIQVPSAAAAMAGAGGEWMARTASDGGTTVGAKTPHAPDASYSMRNVTPSSSQQQPLSASPTSSPGVSPSGPASGQSGDRARSPRSLQPETFPLALRAEHSQDDATPVPDRAAPAFAGPRLRPPRAGDGSAAAPRPLAIHTDVTPPMFVGGFSHPGEGARVGGPTATEMTAASKSPKSPNELRWNKVAGSLDSAASSSSSSSASRARSNSRSSVERATEARRWDRENLPPSPALPDGFEHQQSAPRPVRHSSDERATSSVLQEPPTSRVKVPTSTPASITSRLRLDTSSARVNGSTPAAVSPRSLSARPSTSASTTRSGAGPRPTLARAASTADAVPFPGSMSTAQLAASSGPASAAATTRPAYLRADSGSSSARGGGGGGGGGGGITPSTSASSLASRSSASSGAVLLSPGGSVSGGGASAGRSRAGSYGRPLSPDGARAVEDLDSLMRSIVEMSEGLFDKGDEGGAVETGAERSRAQ
ncbi:hypothetical protein JCM3775_007460 [Rhodotorula graminis]